MHSVFAITLRFLQPTSHGRGENGEPEWPPSPLRAYQALVAAAAARWNEREQLITAVPALKWLEQQSVDVIVAAQGSASVSPYRLYVPDNVADKVAKSWRAVTRRVLPTIARKRTFVLRICPATRSTISMSYLMEMPNADNI